MADMLIVLGALFLTGLAADALGRRTRVPRVTLLLALGVAAGPHVTGMIPEIANAWYEPVSTVALAMVAFLLGGSLTVEALTAHGRAILALSLAIVVATVFGVAAGLWLLGAPLALAITLGAIATATDPAATEDTLRQAGAKGSYAEVLRGVVAIDDAWGMVVFALAIVAAQAATVGTFAAEHLLTAAWEIGGAVALGLVIGLPGALLTGRLRPGEPTRLEALGLVFLTAGLALWLEVSFLLACMATGAVIANLARHHDRAFHEIENIRTPFLILFFILAGASMDLPSLLDLGVLGAGYVTMRIVARWVGGWIGGRLGGLSRTESLWAGPSLMAQAGVAVGMALVAAEALPEHGETILTLTIGTTVLFELIGPVSLSLALRRI